MNLSRNRTLIKSKESEMKKLSFVTLLLLVVSFTAVAEETIYETKMVLVEGKKSYLMDGDPFKRAYKPVNYKKSEVLPSLVSIGWQIKSMQLDEGSTKEELFGYVILERKQQPKK